MHMAHLVCVQDRSLELPGSAGSCFQRNLKSRLIAAIFDLDALSRHHTPSKESTLLDGVSDFITYTISVVRDGVRHTSDGEQGA